MAGREDSTIFGAVSTTRRQRARSFITLYLLRTGR
jgi:hypothetical protein